MHSAITAVAFLACAAAGVSNAQDVVSGEEFMNRVGAGIRNTTVTTEAVGEGLHVLFGAGGNVLASIGASGVLVVDDQFPPVVPKLQTAIRELGGGAVDFVVNTHWHFDHADGNAVLGAEGAWIVAHENSRKRLTADQRINLAGMIVDQPAYPDDALPVITFRDRIQFHFNDQTIELLHFGSAHTAGDVAVWFRQANVVHMGDVFRNGGYPFIDADNGGSLAGLIEFCQQVLEETNSDTTVVPGHGPVGSHADLAAYIVMLRDVHEQLVALIGRGATLEEVIAAKPTARWDATYGDPRLLLNRGYASLSRSSDAH